MSMADIANMTMKEVVFGTYQPPSEWRLWLVGIIVACFIIGGSLLTIIKLFEKRKRSENDHIISKHREELGKRKW